MRVHKLTFAAVIVAAGLSLTACNNDDSSAKSDPTSSTTVTSADGGASSDGSGTGGSDQAATGSGGQGTGTGTSSSGGGSGSGGSGTGTTGSGGQSTSGGIGSDASGKGGKCRTDDLKITATDTFIDGDPAGSVAVGLKNDSGRTCTLAGFAGVDLTTNVGAVSAKRVGAPATAMSLKNGQEVDFNVNYPLNTTGGTGARITGLRVTAPDDTTSVTVRWPGRASLPTGTDTGGQGVEVGPIGSAGQGG
ncbi:Protein of unknown function [Actinacidiphila yanglinensis]|uniref:DUF4232 domain-containing protein n=1 Tax=Actinacidiphila yanglinensis TaxID=310779 RepID=A0A1H6C9N0_9ACTN|nr:DUF4232 domain-containing protein [Actinacidiphila yanglinensis]SEG69076.1 Protein of unknown function [Actinacidiphila yanglinensis]